VIVVSVALLLGGCGQSPPAGSGDKAVHPVAGYEFEVRGADGAHTSGHAETFSVQAGANSAEVKGGKLTVNGKAYGAVADGAKIIVDVNGKVTVNGDESLPE
jgi:hypothetical protein